VGVTSLWEENKETKRDASADQLREIIQSEGETAEDGLVISFSPHSSPPCKDSYSTRKNVSLPSTAFESSFDFVLERERLGVEEGDGLAVGYDVCVSQVEGKMRK